VDSFGLIVIRGHPLPTEGSRVTVEQSESCVGIGGNPGRAQEVPAFERGVTVYVPIVRLREDDIEQ
jgi:hypothetical protein